MTNKSLTYDELGIGADDICTQMGYRGAAPDEATLHELLAITGEAGTWLRPRFCFFVTPRMPAFNVGRTIDKQLQGSEAYALFVATAGVEFEAWQQRLKDGGDMVRTFIADALGSVIAERCADKMEEILQQSIDKLGWKHTNRFSPGYCGWHVSEQRELFAEFARKGESAPCGVTLTTSSLMVPIKSVSGIIGIGRNVRHLDYTCGLCDQKLCYKKRI